MVAGDGEQHSSPVGSPDAVARVTALMTSDKCSSDVTELLLSGKLSWLVTLSVEGDGRSVGEVVIRNYTSQNKLKRKDKSTREHRGLILMHEGLSVHTLDKWNIRNSQKGTEGHGYTHSLLPLSNVRSVRKVHLLLRYTNGKLAKENEKERGRLNRVQRGVSNFNTSHSHLSIYIDNRTGVADEHFHQSATSAVEMLSHRQPDGTIAAKR